MRSRFYFLFALKALAAPIGNPASSAILQEGLLISDTVWTQPRVGFFEDFTLNHRLVGSSLKNVSLEGTSIVGSLVWSMFERLDIALLLGSGQNTFRMMQGTKALETRVSGGLIWYGEGKLILLEVQDTTFSAFGEAGGWDWMTGPFYADDRPVASNAHLKMRFWETGVALSQQIGFFSPYLGVVVMHSRWKMDHTSLGILRFHQKYPVGPFLGCTLSKGVKILLNIEWRGWVENALALSGEVRF